MLLELAQLLLAVLLPLFRGVAPADTEMLFEFWATVPLSQSLVLVPVPVVPAGALVLSLRFGVAILPLFRYSLGLMCFPSCTKPGGGGRPLSYILPLSLDLFFLLPTVS